MKKLLLLILLLFTTGCFGVVILTGDYGTDVIRTPYSEGVCVEKAVDLKRAMEKQGYEAKVVSGRMDGYKNGHAWVEYKKNGKWITINPNDIKEIY